MSAPLVYIIMTTPLIPVLPIYIYLKCIAGGRVCSFSPCIEQVQRSCEKMAELGFCDIETMECLLRNFDVRTLKMPVPDLGYEDKIPGANGKSGSVDIPPVGKYIKGSQDVDDSEEIKPKNKRKNEKGNWQQEKCKGDMFSFKSCTPPQVMPGHTGYLTFATLFPSST